MIEISSQNTPSSDTRPIAATPAEAGPAATDASLAFSSVGLHPNLQRAVADQGYTVMTPIQAKAIPHVLAGRDIMGAAQTGTGKTAAFSLPLLHKMLPHENSSMSPARHPVRALVIAPTRELADQVAANIKGYAAQTKLRVAVVYGGIDMKPQTLELKAGVEVLVATPGRLKDLMRQGACDLSDIEITVLDEADHMADMGFLPDVTDILDAVKPGGQRLLFSATLDKDVDVLVKRYLNDPVTHAIGPVDEPVATMDHHLLLVAPKEKSAITAEIANREGRTILFARTKHGVDRLAKQLVQVGVRAAGLHGGKSQGLRTRTLAEFREGTISVLVATDVAARGIHVDDVTLVMHVDPPADSKDYMHRAGRTARAGERGTVVTLVLPHQVRSTSAMTRRAGINAPRVRVTTGDTELVKLTGARPPSGIPIEEPLIPERPRREGGRGRQGGGRRRGPRTFDRGDGPRRRDGEGGRGEHRSYSGGDRRGGPRTGAASHGSRRNGPYNGNRRDNNDARPARYN
jgi:superfamily II DNA/RNA helicase